MVEQFLRQYMAIIAEKKEIEIKELEKMFDDELKKVVSDAKKGLI